MSSVDDILYAPVLEPWRKLCREVVAYIEQQPLPSVIHYPIDRPRPEGSLLLEPMIETFHVRKQNEFFYVVGGTYTKLMEAFDIDGTLVFERYEHGSAPKLGEMHRSGRSIRDLNLVPNTYNRNYVFANEREGRTYFKSF